MMWKSFFVVMMTLIGVSVASLYPIGDNYSVDLLFIPSADTHVDEIISYDNGTITAMATKFLGGNGGTIIVIEEFTCEGVADISGIVPRGALGCNFHTRDAKLMLNTLMLRTLEGSFYPDLMDIASSAEDNNISYATTDNPYEGWIGVVPIEMVRGQNSNAFGSLGRAAEEANEETLKGYIGFINGHDFVLVLSTEQASVFRTTVGGLNVISREDKGKAVLDDIMSYL